MDSIRNFFRKIKEGLANLFFYEEPEDRNSPARPRGRAGARSAADRGEPAVSRGRVGRSMGARAVAPRRPEPREESPHVHEEPPRAAERPADHAYFTEEERESGPETLSRKDFEAKEPEEPRAREPMAGAPAGERRSFYSGFNLWARRGAEEEQGRRGEPGPSERGAPGAEDGNAPGRFVGNAGDEGPAAQAPQAHDDGGEAKKGAEGSSSGFTGWLGRVGIHTGAKLPAQGYAVDRIGMRAARGAYDRAAVQDGETHEFMPVAAEARREKGLKGLFQKRQKPPNALLGVAFTSLQLFVYALLVLGVAGIGAVIGIAKAYTDTAPVLDVGKIQNQDLTSFIYDGNGDLITTFAGAQNRVWATIDEIPVDLQHAIVAVEDSRFYSHNGVDLKRIVGVFLNNMDSDSTQGGSTITQQLIKNTLGSSERTYKRKIQEAWLAMQLEAQYGNDKTKDGKDKILEAYLNTIPLGESDYGVKAAAQDYFGKSLDQLTLRECAMLAGLAQSPYLYDPRLNMYTRNRMDLTDKRTNTVLLCMYQQGFIDKQQYEDALKETVSILETGTKTQMYDMPYFVEYALDDIKAHLLKQRNLEDTPENRSKIDSELRTGGYEIYLTVDPQIQKTVEDTLYNYTKYPKMQLTSYNTYNGVIQPQAAAVVLDYHTGELKAVVGGRQQPTALRTLNRAYQQHMPVGSCIKPIAVYAPALDMGMSPASIIYNVPAPISGWKDTKGNDIYPKNYSGDPFTGPTSIRVGLIHSYNVVAAHVLMDEVGLDKAYDTLMKLGVKQTASNNIKKDGPGLALGTSGITTVEMAAAFGALGNKGEYIEPLSFSKIIDSHGNTVLDAGQVRVKTQVFKPSTAWMMIDMMKEVITKGTGTRAKLSGMTVAGKTGTNSDYRGVSFCALTPYYSAEVWVGSDGYKPLYKGATGGKDAAPLWKEFMQQIHDDRALEDKPIIADSPESLGLVKVKVCGVSGLLTTDACALDTQHPPVTDWFLQGTEPTSYCNMHAQLPFCKESGMLATPFCPPGDVEMRSILIVPQDSIIRRLSPEDVKKYFPSAILDLPGVDDLSQITYDNPFYAQYFCTIHTQDWADMQTQYGTLVSQANSLVSEVRQKMQTYWISQTQRDRLNGLIETVNGYIEKGFSDPAEPPQQVYNNLLGAVNELRSYADQVLVATPQPTHTWAPTEEPTASPTP
jgi:penicillin-binding protein 1A